MENNQDVLLKVEHLKKYYSIKSSSLRGKKSVVKAVDDISFDVKIGETFGIVGESGCGKSTMGKSVIRLIEPTEGKVILDGQDFTSLKGKELQEKMGIAYIFISHDLSVVKHIADRVGVMYLGNMMEMADTESLYAKPLHPYTQALFSAIPRIGKERIEDKQILGGDVPSPANPPKGCRFCTRCPKVMDICKTDRPDFKEVEPGHFCACHLYDKK